MDGEKRYAMISRSRSEAAGIDRIGRSRDWLSHLPEKAVAKFQFDFGVSVAGELGVELKKNPPRFPR